MSSDSKAYRLRQPVPAGRTYESLVRHYEVEKSIADRLRAAGREERKRIFATMYDELFTAVPDHPRLTAAIDPAGVEARNRAKFMLVKNYLTPDSIVLEFAPGDCAFARHLAARVKRIITVDISNQAVGGGDSPVNWRQIVYDGYSLAFDEKADLAFSDQFIEHLVPEDVDAHLRLVRSLLVPGGRYVICTPHSFHGPHDISVFFSRKPEGFHIKEWTCSELGRLLLKAGFSDWIGRRRVRGEYRDFGKGYWITAEGLLCHFPYGLRKLLARVLVPRHLVITASA
jgi:hypothetical protein